MTQFTSLPTARYQIKSRQNYLRLLTDVMLVCTSYVLSSQLSHRAPHLHDILLVGGLCICWYFVAKLTALYNDFRTATFVDELLALIPNIFFQFLTLSIFLFFLRDYAFARTFCLFFAAVLGLTIVTKMYLTRKLLQYWHRQGIYQKNVAIVGESTSVSGFVKLLDNNVQFGYQVMGTWIAREITNDTASLGQTLRYLEGLFLRNHFDELVIVSGKFKENYIRGLIEWADSKGVLVRFTPVFFQFSSSRYSLELFGGIPLITVRCTPLESDQWWILKQVFDFILGVLFFGLIGVWLFPLIALAIKLNSQGPVFFVQKRWGLKGREINVWKFRTMYHQAPTTDEQGNFHQTKANDPRITAVGKFLRKTNLDEFPQFINVLLGDMSVIGPRPHALKHSEETAQLIDNYMIRHRIKPGITGWAQVNGFRGETKELNLMRKRVDYDIWYIENWSFLLDLQILVRTIYNMWKGDPKAY
jgi:putative colanic acid biosynthesis UDP-glucose lipid carrier transferase